MSTKLLTTLTPCPRSHGLCQQRVRVVINEADIESAYTVFSVVVGYATCECTRSSYNCFSLFIRGLGRYIFLFIKNVSKISRHCCNIQESKVHRIQFTQRSKYKKQSYISLQYGQLSGGGNIPQPPFFPPLPSRRWADYAENSPSPGPAVRNSVPASTSLQLPDPLPLSLYSTTSPALTPSWVLPCPPPSPLPRQAA